MRITASFLAGTVILGLIVTGCKKKGEEPPPPPAVDSEMATAVAQDVVVDATANLPDCDTVPAAEVIGQDMPLTAGTYCVCDPGPAGPQTHPGTQDSGRHLRKGEMVTIGSPDDATDVKLGASSLDFIKSPDSKELSAFLSYLHNTVLTSGGGPTTTTAKITHLVKISRAQNYEPPDDESLPRCHPETNNVIRIQYCFRGTKNGALQWLCPEEAGSTHLGDIHAEN